jgi:hypothetical protein
MTDQHRATPEQWASQKAWAVDDDDSACLIDLHARVEALEADQLEQAESQRFCVDAIVRRIEALEAAPQDKLDRLIALDAADPTPDPAMPELRAASAEARPASSLDQMIIDAMLAAHVKGGGTSFPVPHPDEIKAAIREVATWLDRFALHGSGEYAQAAKVLRQEVGQ